MTNDDKVIPKGKWEFDEEVTKVFENMLSRSIPDYESMRNIVYSIGRNYIVPNTDIVDIGCSNGLSVMRFVKDYSHSNHFMLIDVSEPMLDSCRKIYSGRIADGIMDVCNMDLREEYPKCVSSLTLSILTLQFTPIEYRHKILKNIYDSLIPGGALIIVEKVLGSTSDIDDILVKEYYEMKKSNSYTQEQIQTKRKSLEGVLVPITFDWNEDLLRKSGFNRIECIWRYYNFAGWLAIK